MNRSYRPVVAAVLACLLLGSLLSVAVRSAGAATPVTLDLKVLLVGTGSTDPTTAAWASALSQEGVPYTEVTATGTYGAETVTLPTLSAGSVGDYNGVVIADSPAAFAAGQLSALDTYESTFSVRQIDGYTAPYTGIGLTEVSTGALDGTTGTLTAAGLSALPELAGPIPFATGTNGYWATPVAGAPFTPWLDNSAGQVLAGVYEHPSTDAQAGVAELELGFDYNATQLQWELLAPGLVNWVTDDSHLGINRNYVEMDIDDTFTPDNAWSVAVHDNDYSDADSQRMDPSDVISAADWSDPTQENDASARPAGEPATAFRLDQLFNYGGTVEYQNGELDLPGEPASCDTAGDAAGTCGPDPLLAQFQATDPATGKPYSDDFGWLSHTYDTPYLDVGCASQDYIEAELNENTSDVTAAPGTTAGTGGLGLPEQSIASGASDVADPYGTYNPQVFVPGNHSGFADLDPGTPATVDPPDLDEVDPATTGGTLGAGTYEYAVTDQFNGADPTSTDQSQAYVTDGLQGDLAPVVVTGSTGSVSLVWQSICHAANYIIYRAPVTGTTVGPWTEIGTYATPDSATLPDASSGDTSPAQSATVCSGPTYAPTSCAGEQELTFTDTGGTSATPPAGVTYLDDPMPAGWTPPVVEDANELPWEQNPYFSPALTAAGITTVGADASKAYPDPANDAFGIGADYTGATYAAGQPFVDGTSQVAPRHPINIFYNVATNAQELDEYNTLYTSSAPDSQCHDTATTTCATTPFTFADVINQVVSGMLTNVLSNDPEISYVHQTNIMGTPPYSSILPPAGYVPAATAQPGTDGDGTLYEVLNPLISEYDSYFTADTPYVQLTLGGVGQVLADQTAWTAAETAGTVTASEENGVVTVKNTGTGAVNVPVTAPKGTTVGTSAFGTPYDGQSSAWTSVAADGSVTLTEHVAPTITSADSAASIVGAPFSTTVTTTGDPAPALTETGALPTGVTFVDNGNGTATISGTPAAGTGGSYPLTITATSTAGTATQAFTLTNSEAPTITSASTATFSTGVAGTYTVTTTGYPAATITESGTLPKGLTFAAGTTGTATIAGTAASGTAGTYPVSVSATNSSGSTATLALTITVNVGKAPTITSGASADFTLGDAGSFAVTTTGSPIPAITETGALPSGLTFTDQGNGTALVSGTPTATGTTVLDITAANSIAPNATQALSVVVGQAPTITSAATDTATVGAASTFTVTTTGYPAPSLGETGTLPAGVTFVNNGNGTATLGGTPAAGTGGSYPISITAINGTGSTTQTFTLTVDQAPAITSAASASFGENAAGSLTVTTTGYPAPTLTEAGTLPAGVTFVAGTAGTATLAGTPAFLTAGTYPLTVTATNAASTVTQDFTLTVAASPPVFTSATSTTFSENSAGTFAVAAKGDTPITYTESGALPAGVSLAADGTLAGTPAFLTGGTYPINVTATDANHATTTQDFTLTVTTSPPVFTSAASATFGENSAGSFAVTANGDTPVAYTETGALPAGVALAGNGTLSGTPAFGTAGTYRITVTATDLHHTTTTQDFVLTVTTSPPVFTSAASAIFGENNAGSFSVTAKGDTPVAYTETGTLPAGVALASNGTLSGTPEFGTSGTYPITITATDVHHATTTQAFTFAVDTSSPVFTSAASTTFSENRAGSFPVTANGDAPIAYSETGALPAGVTLADNGTLSGTPAFLAAGTYPITITATDGNHATTAQSFTLKVTTSPPVFTSATSTAFSENSAGSFPVTANGDAPIAYTETGALPAGATLAGNGTLSGTPDFGTAGTYRITVTATDLHHATTTQVFTLTVVASPPEFISAASTTFSENNAGSFAVTAVGDTITGYTETGALPAGVALAGNGTLSGTPAFGTSGTYPITVTATDGNHATTTQDLTLTVAASPPVFGSAASTTFTENNAGTFSVTAKGDAPIVYTERGALPGGVTLAEGVALSANGTLSGTPAFDTAGTYRITVTATDGNHATTSRTFTLTVSASPPAFTSAASTTFSEDHGGTFTVRARGDKPIRYTESGALPSGITLAADGTLSGTPAFGTAGTYPIAVTATDLHHSTTTQAYSLTVSASSPVFTSTDSTTFTAPDAGSFAVRARGDEPIAYTEAGALPAGVTLSGNGTLSGTPDLGADGRYPITITATDDHGKEVTQQFSLVVDQAPAITSANSVSSTVGTAFSFGVTTSGYPVGSLGETGALPTGVGFADLGDGSAALSGTPAPGTAGTYPITLTVSNGISPDATQTFTLTVDGVPALTGGGQLAATPDGLGYWIVSPTGSIDDYGSAANYGSMAGLPLNRPIVGIASTPDGKGYWMVASDGGVFSFGDAGFYGSTGSITLNQPIVGIATTPDGKGYWMVAADGGVFAFGDAGFYGSTGSITLNQPVVGMASTPDGKGYWMVASDGGVFAFGDAGFYGSAGGIHLNQPIMGMTATRDGHGYWMVASDGGIFTYGDAGFFGSGGGSGATAVGIIASPNGPGYALVDADGTRTDFGF